MAQSWPTSLRYQLRDNPALQIEHEAFWDTYGLALRDGEGEEHHFGFPKVEQGSKVFTFVTSYTDEGRDATWPGGVHDKLIERGYELVEPTLGPKLSPVAEVAMKSLADYATRKGFAFDEERARAVQVFGALARGHESFDPEEVYVWGATNGYAPKAAEKLREYASRAISGRGTRSVGGRALKVDSERADLMLSAWRDAAEDS